MCAFLNGNNTQIQGQFHSAAVVCSCCFQFETLKASFSQSTPCARLYTALSVMRNFISLAVPALYTHATDFQCLTILFSAGDSLCCSSGASPNYSQARNSSCNPPYHIIHRTAIGPLHSTELQIIEISGNMHSMQTA